MTNTKNSDGVVLTGLGVFTLDDVFDDPNGIDYALIDNEYYYVFPDKESGSCGDSFWMVNRNNRLVSTTSITQLFDTPEVLERLDTLEKITPEELRRALS